MPLDKSSEFLSSQTDLTFYWDMDCVKHEDLPCYSISITNDNYSNCWYDNYNIFGY